MRKKGVASSEMEALGGVGASSAGVHAGINPGEPVLRLPRTRALRGGNGCAVSSLGSGA